MKKARKPLNAVCFVIKDDWLEPFGKVKINRAYPQYSKVGIIAIACATTKDKNLDLYVKL